MDPVMVDDRWTEKASQLEANRRGLKRKLDRSDLPPDERTNLEFHFARLEEAISRHYVIRQGY